MIEPNLIPPIMKKPSHHRLLWSALVALIIIVALVAVSLIIDYQKNHHSLDDSLKNMANNLQNNQVEASAPKRDGEIVLSAGNTVVKVGDTLTVKILLNTKQANIVLAGATISYDKNLLSLLPDNKGILVDDSVLNMSIMENRKAGEVEIVRGSPGNADYLDSGNGYTGENGLLATLKFKALAPGTAKISFVLSNPGLIYGTTDVSSSIVDKKNSTASSLILDDGRGTLMNTEFKDLTVEIK